MMKINQTDTNMVINNNDIDNQHTVTPQEGFSWHRVGLLYRYYGTIVNKQTLIYFIVSALCAVLTLLPVHEMIQVSFFTLIWTVLPLMYTLAPCAFGQQSASPIVERLIPARASEKLAFFLSYLLVVLPIAVYALPVAAMWLYSQIPSVQTHEMMELLDLRASSPTVLQLFNTLSSVALVLACLLVVENARSNKIFKGIITVIAFDFLLGLLGAVRGFVYVFQEGIKAGKAGIDPENPHAITQKMIEEITCSPSYMTFMYILLIAIAGIMIWRIYVTLKRKNL